ncbi:MAG: hypothetical protein ACREBV_00395 [Candidatus Zixiibacteriota bacterium]
MAFRRSRTTRRSVRRGGRRRSTRPWTRGECAFMRKFYRNHETKWVARQLGRTVYAVRYKAVDLNLGKATPTVWKGNRGSKNAFRKYRGQSTPAGRHSRPRRRTTRSHSWRATSRRRTRTTRRTRTRRWGRRTR